MVISQCEPAYLESLIRYNKAVLQRNAMLKMEQEPDLEVMALWEEEMAREGEFIFSRRRAHVEQFVPIFQHYYNQISLQREQVELQYVSHCQRGPLLEVIQRDRFKDRAVGYSLHGVHKDELEMSLSGYPIRREGSQGQNKTFLVSLKLAQYDFLRSKGGEMPLLLLDDIFDKLDSRRVEQIISLVAGEGFGQIFITDVNREHIDQILESVSGGYRLFEVQGGCVELLKTREV
jgi:DNA replication and repair protein RecF